MSFSSGECSKKKLQYNSRARHGSRLRCFWRGGFCRVWQAASRFRFDQRIIGLSGMHANETLETPTRPFNFPHTVRLPRCIGSNNLPVCTFFIQVVTISFAKLSPTDWVVETIDICVSPTATTTESHRVRRALHRLCSYRTWHTGDTLTGLDPHTTQAAPDMGGAFPSEVSLQPPR